MSLINCLRLIRIAALPAAAVVLLTLTTGLALGHSEYRSSEPADKAVLTEPPARIEALFSATMKPEGSNLILQAPGGAEVAEGTLLAGDETRRRMSIEDLPALEPGRYTVIWNTVALDNDAATGSWTFSVEASASPSPSPSPSAAPTTAASPTAAASPSPSAAASPSLSVAPSPAASPDESPTGSGGTSLLLPIVAAIVVAAVASFWALRRSRA